MNVVLPFRKAGVAETMDWDALYSEHVGRVFNFFRYRVGDSATAEDLTATTFEKAWSRRGQFRGDVARFTGWLYAIARNVAHDYFRKSPSLVTLDSVGQTAAPGNLADQIEQARTFATLVAALQKLPERERDLVARPGDVRRRRRRPPLRHGGARHPLHGLDSAWRLDQRPRVRQEIDAVPRLRRSGSIRRRRSACDHSRNTVQK